MLKFREGKMMLFVMILIFGLTAASAFVMPQYHTSGYYKFAVWFFLIDLVLLALCQIYFARKLYKIAGEMSKVSSKTDTTVEE